MASPPSDRHTSFAEFYAATGSSLLRHLHALLGDRSEAQDCLQEAYARAWDRWDSVREYDEPGAWVRRVAIRLAISRFRRAKNMLRAHLRLGSPSSAAPPEPDAVDAVGMLRRLPDAQREALVLHHLLDLSVKEVAQVTGAGESAVKARLARGRAAMADLLGQPAEAEADRRSPQKEVGGV